MHLAPYCAEKREKLAPVVTFGDVISDFFCEADMYFGNGDQIKTWPINSHISWFSAVGVSHPVSLIFLQRLVVPTRWTYLMFDTNRWSNFVTGVLYYLKAGSTDLRVTVLRSLADSREPAVCVI